MAYRLTYISLEENCTKNFQIFLSKVMFDKKWYINYFAFKQAGVVAQLVEHHNGIVGVRGSNPLGSTNFFILL